MIDITDSTHKWPQNRDVIYAMADFIIDPANNFVNFVKQGYIQIVENLFEYVKKVTGRKEPSICSKVCRYFSKMLFKNDAFYAYDSIVITMLPYYLTYYKVGSYQNDEKYFESLKDSYSDFHKEMDALRCVCPGISRLELDHLVWYAHKKK